jgi:hypothetical protein
LRGVPRRIPPFRLDAHPLTPEAEATAGFEWASPDVGTRHRIGGEPDGVPESEYPRCRSCGHPMSFYGQLDSIGDHFALADVGVVHVFVCFDCFEAAARVAST